MHPILEKRKRRALKISGKRPQAFRKWSSLSLMLTQVNRNKLSLPRLVALMAEAPAKEYGIFPQKGVIKIGSDADLVVVDMDRETRIDDTSLITAPKYSAFHGYTIQGLPVMTMLRGKVVMENGKIIDSPPSGAIVRPRR